jgi:hypothetical protein
VLELLLVTVLLFSTQNAVQTATGNLSNEASAAVTCPPDGNPVVTRLPQGGVRYCGRIDEAGVAATRNLLRRDDSRLVITSIGGSLAAPLELAKLVLDFRLDVEVSGPCFSGCASAVFIAGERRYIGSTGVLGFHNTQTSSFLLASRVFQADRGTNFELLQKRSAEELRLYAIKGVDLTLLVQPQSEIGTLCISKTETGTSVKETVFNLISDSDIWLPSRETLIARGVAILGSYPRSEGDARERLARYFGPISFPVKVRFGNGAPVTKMYDHFYKINRC